MNVHHLELFYHVAKYGGVSAAARHMPYGIQQPAISALAIVSGGLFAGVFIGKFTRYVEVFSRTAPRPAE